MPNPKDQSYLVGAYKLNVMGSNGWAALLDLLSLVTDSD